MNKLFLIVSILLIKIVPAVSQNTTPNNKQLIKVTYIAIPTSQYQNSPNSSSNTIDKDQLLASSYKYYYTLIINPTTQQSIYTLDSLVIKDKPEGMKDYVLLVYDSLAYVV